MVELIINEKNCGGRLDRAIFKYLDKASQGFVYKMLRKKNITLNDKKAAGSEILQAGDSIKLYLADETIARFRSSMNVRAAKNGRYERAAKDGEGICKKKSPKVNLKNLIVYEDEHILAINKPVGMLSQRSTPNDISVNDFIRDYIPTDGIFTPGVSNRLDRNTAGLVLAGRSQAASRELSRAIKERCISKKYLTVASGCITEAQSETAYLVKDEKANKVIVSSEKTDDAWQIITRFKPLACNGSETLLEVDLVTGKPHQIRAHLAFLGHPVVGDTKYGNEELNMLYYRKYGLKSQLLHAYKIGFAGMEGILEYLNGTVIEAQPPYMFTRIMEGEGLWPLGAREDSEALNLKK